MAFRPTAARYKKAPFRIVRHLNQRWVSLRSLSTPSIISLAGRSLSPQRVQKIEGLRLRFFLSHGVHLQFGWTPILRLQPAISEVQKIERLQRYGSQNLSQGTEATA